MATRDYTTYARNAVRVWMRQVMDERGWSANEWATLAGTSPTNITRLMSPTSKIIPSVETIAKLAAVARSQPNLVPGIIDNGNGGTEAPPSVNYCPDCGFDLRNVTRRLPPKPHYRSA